MSRKKKSSARRILFDNKARGIDKILVFRFFKLLHGRFWGLGSIISILIGAVIGYAIRPDLLSIDTPLSRLGTDIRTAPFFAGSMFFAAYSLWRWRIYLGHTLRNKQPIIPLLSLAILGLYLIALMPVTWLVWPSRLHHFGVFILGVSMLCTVLFDTIFTNNRKTKHKILWDFIKLTAFVTILLGGVLVALSFEQVNILNVILLGEALMYVGYSSWVILKVALGEGKQSAIGRIVQKIIG